VVDVILQVQKVVRDSQEEDTTGGKDNDKPPTTDIDDPAAGQKLDDRTVVSFGVQVTHYYVSPATQSTSV
jgi:hypothetical protein